MTQGAAEDLWHLSIDDLFVTPVETPPLEGPGPFVINLSASTAPIGIPVGGLTGFEKLKLYQLSRKEDGRDRFRLRLGFFETPDSANEALAALRERYPSAFAANAAEEDLRFFAARSEPAPRAEPVPAPPVARVAAQSPQPRAGGVRNDTGRRPHKRRDIRRDHDTHARSSEAHGQQRDKTVARHAQHAAKNSTRAATSKAPIAPIAEDIDVEAILLAALEPTPSGSKDNNPLRAAEAKQPRPQTKAQSKPEPAAPRPAAKSEAHAVSKTETHAIAKAEAHSSTLGPAPTPAPVARAVSAHIAAPAPVATAPARAPVVSTASAESAPIQATVPAATATPTAAETSPVIADASAAANEPHSAEPVKPVPPSPISAEPVAPAAIASSPAPAPVDDESLIITHPRVDAPAVAAGETPATDNPIDLHLIDRIFEDEIPSEDDVPTVEVLALQSPETPLATEAKSAAPTEAKSIPMEAKSPPVLEPDRALPAKPPGAVDLSQQANPPVTAPAPPMKEARSITSHDILALLTQPIPVARSLVARALKSKAAKPVLQVLGEPAPEPADAAVVSSAVESAPPPKEGGEAARAAPVVSERDQQDVNENATPEVGLELVPETPRGVVEVAGPLAPPEALSAAPVASAAPLTPATAVAADSTVDAMAVQIESQLDSVMSLELEVTGQRLRLAPDAAAEQPAETPVKLTLELELVPDPEDVPVLVDIIEEVTVSEVIIPRREPQRPAPVHKVPAAAPSAAIIAPPSAVTAGSVQVAPSPPARAKSQAMAVREPKAPPARVDSKATPTARVEPKPPQSKWSEQASLAAKHVAPGRPQAKSPQPKPAVTKATEPKSPVVKADAPKAPAARPVEPRPAEFRRPEPNAAAAARDDSKPRVNPPSEARPKPAPANDTKKAHAAVPAEPKARPTAPTPAKAPVAPPPAEAAPKRPVVIFDAPVEDMDSTQTLRALTPLELTDDTQSKWFAVQLSLSEEQVKVDSLPHIDIFDEYRLYSISGIDQGRFVHSLRLGFFSSETSAQFVAGYLRSYFESAEIKRVSIAEHDRFAERKAKSEKADSTQTSPQAAEQRSRTTESRNARGEASEGANGASGTSGSNPRPGFNKARRSVDSSPTGRHKTLGEELYEEARQTVLAQSAIRRLPKNSSLWSRLFGQDKD